ncbi:hypothetical protein ACWGIU_06170 [Streptomyces sp. NPDC054840]
MAGLARLHAAHRDPVGRLVPFERPEVLLSLTKPDDVLSTARVELSGMETMGHLHDLIRTVTHGVTMELGYAGPGVALEVLVGKRHELALHPAHVDGLARLLRQAVGTIAARGTPGGAGASTATEPGLPARCGSRHPGEPERLGKPKATLGKPGLAQGVRLRHGGGHGLEDGALLRVDGDVALAHRAERAAVGAQPA